jgi:hypothetical protein
MIKFELADFVVDEDVLFEFFPAGEDAVAVV